MRARTLKADSLLLLTAIIWGSAFVAQRVGMEHVGPFIFTGIRFALGSLVMLPLLSFNGRQRGRVHDPWHISRVKTVLLASGMAGTVLFVGASLQQIGLVYTTAGKAGFITGLYVVIVPLLGIFWKRGPGIGTWAGAILSAVGLYFLSVTETFTIAFGDFLELAGAFFWAGHVLILAWLSPRIEPVKLAFFQYAACSILSLAAAFLAEDITFMGLYGAAVPILYGGLLSVGVAYTLQVVAQRDAHPAHAAILMSLEAVFAAVGGWLILDETLSSRGLFGCVLMLVGMIISQVWIYIRK